MLTLRSFPSCSLARLAGLRQAPHGRRPSSLQLGLVLVDVVGGPAKHGQLDVELCAHACGRAPGVDALRRRSSASTFSTSHLLLHPLLEHSHRQQLAGCPLCTTCPPSPSSFYFVRVELVPSFGIPLPPLSLSLLQRRPCVRLPLRPTVARFVRMSSVRCRNRRSSRACSVQLDLERESQVEARCPLSVSAARSALLGDIFLKNRCSGCYVQEPLRAISEPRLDLLKLNSAPLARDSCLTTAPSLESSLSP